MRTDFIVHSTNQSIKCSKRTTKETKASKHPAGSSKTNTQGNEEIKYFPVKDLFSVLGLV